MSKFRRDISKCPEMDYFMNESVSDVVFVIEGQPLSAIKLILSMKNNVFKAMFSDEWKESKDKEVVIKETTFEAFKTLIQFLYCEILVLKDNKDFDLIEEICKLADRYDVPKFYHEMDKQLSEMALNSSDLVTLNRISKIAIDYKLEEMKSKNKNDVSECPEIYYFMNESVRDFVFIIDGQQIPVIKLILSLKSKVFRAMFSGDFKESKDKELVDTTFEAFKTLIQFLYCEILVLKDNNDFQLIQEVCKLADRYEVPKLLDKVNDHLMYVTLFSSDSVALNWISKIGFDYKLEEVMTKVLAFIEQNFKGFLKLDNKELIELGNSTHNHLWEVMANNYRKLSKELDIIERGRCPHCKMINNRHCKEPGTPTIMNCDHCPKVFLKM